MPQRKAKEFEDCISPEPMSGCWLWMGSLDRDGYGQTVGKKADGKLTSFRAHRIAFEKARGPIPDGLVIDHKCRVRSCVNPDHMEPVTNMENIRRGETGQFRLKNTHCPNGHEYTQKTRKDGSRICLTCNRERDRRRRPPGTRAKKGGG